MSTEWQPASIVPHHQGLTVPGRMEKRMQTCDRVLLNENHPYSRRTCRRSTAQDAKATGTRTLNILLDIQRTSYSCDINTMSATVKYSEIVPRNEFPTFLYIQHIYFISLFIYKTNIIISLNKFYSTKDIW